MFTDCKNGKEIENHTFHVWEHTLTLTADGRLF